MDAFSAASGLEGFIGACLVDSGSGLMLASRGGGPINLEAAAALNSQVVRAEQQVIETLGTQDRIEDILITVGKQIHLIRPFEKAPDVFLYLVLEEKAGTFGLARRQAKSVETALMT